MTGLQTLNRIRVAYVLAFALLIIAAVVGISEAKTASERGTANVGALILAVASVLAPFVPLPSLRGRRARRQSRDRLFSYQETLTSEAVAFGPNGAHVVSFLHNISRLTPEQWRLVQDRQDVAGGSLVRRYLTFHRRARAIRALETALLALKRCQCSERT